MMKAAGSISRTPGGVQSAIAALMPKAVLHFAALSPVSLSFQEPFTTISTNLMGRRICSKLDSGFLPNCLCLYRTEPGKPRGARPAFFSVGGGRLSGWQRGEGEEAPRSGSENVVGNSNSDGGRCGPCQKEALARQPRFA